MRFKLNGIKYKYSPKYIKREDDFNVKKPSYTLYRNGKIYYDGEWKNCNFRLFEKSGITQIEIGTTGIFKDGMSEIGKVDSRGNKDVIELPKLRIIQIKVYDFLFLTKIRFLSVFDKIELIKKNLNYILIAFIGSIIYFLINHFYDSFLQELINKSNLVQSIIVFLSLSSIFNIFHPFTLRKEWTIDEIDL